jgi:hypothetical protein
MINFMAVAFLLLWAFVPVLVLWAEEAFAQLG